MAFSRAVAYKLSGPLDQAPMHSLRTSLALTPEGRFTDDQDEIFGRRVVPVGDGQVQIRLLRDDVREGWEVDLSLDGDARPDVLAPIEEEILAAAAAAGLTVEGVLRLG
ncbi:hypothetical protein GCM10010168_89060 [Actinoplanes ianthinogenes]|uniref:Uncharacterized protein n=1 Tax=Actinoplanes ianthinogenes TaxID=122358 RepID=A0ABM7LQ33_9ACTN|nr:hypothetical protein [Actinoplanes ianthinogenes]BCJ41334.1 hypothetical protein Aiant_19910 [Actinoplanes ianthinogenes]GGR56343.1 hypothetical protein GCM10010168_89060 [Actinoplanes ianthinogenes]